MKPGPQTSAGWLWGVTLALVLLVSAPPALPRLSIQDASAGVRICACGCGRVEGVCCCSAHPASELGARCTAGDDTGDTMRPSVRIGPPRRARVPEPAARSAAPPDVEQVYAGLDRQPETPPPKG